jgi:anti-sigma B factor antagonist
MAEPVGAAAQHGDQAVSGALSDPTDAVITVEHAPPGVGGRQLIWVGGEIDMLTAPRLRQALTASVAVRGADVVVDLDRVTFLGSNGLGVLVELHQQAEAAGANFRLVCANRTVSRPLTLTGLDQVLDFYESHEDLPPVSS